MSKETHNGKKGGLFKGPSHAKGGIKGIVTDTNQPIEVEGGEIIINKSASAEHCETLSKINQSSGNGVAIPCDKQAISSYFEAGGQVYADTEEYQNDLNETVSSIELALKYATDPEELDILTRNLKTLKDQLDPFVVDEKIDSLKRKYIDKAIDEILDLKAPELELKRKKILSWIKNKEKNVQVLIAFSGGKDSVAMVLKCLYEWNIPAKQIKLFHHEVDGADEKLFDWPCTTSYCKAFAAAVGVEILFSYSGGGILREMYRENETRQPMYFQTEQDGPFHVSQPRKQKDDYKTRLKWPAISNDLQTRWCSSVAKIEVMSRCITNDPAFEAANIVIMTGERRVESTNRSKYKEVEEYKGSTKKRTVITWRSIIDLLDSEVWDLYKKYGIQAHPCYELGWGRCSCQLCIFSNENIWASNNLLSPEKIKRVAEIEEDLKAKGSDLPYLYAKKATKPQLLGYAEIMKEIEALIYPSNDKPIFVKDFKDAKLNPKNKREVLFSYFDTDDQSWHNGDKLFKNQTLSKKLLKLINELPAPDLNINASGYIANGIYKDQVQRGKSFLKADAVKRWKNEALSEFTSPIFISNWSLPIGAKDGNQCGAN